METSYQSQRRYYLGNIQKMLDESRHPPWSIVMQHERSDTRHIIEHANLATQGMVKAFKTMIGYLEDDHPLESLINHRSLPCYAEHDFSNSAKDGAASALRDAALLIVSFDPSTFSSHASGKILNDLIHHLNGTLHLWLLVIHRQWQLLKDDSTIKIPVLLNEKIPPPEREKATFRSTCGFKCLAFSTTFSSKAFVSSAKRCRLLSRSTNRNSSVTSFGKYGRFIK